MKRSRHKVPDALDADAYAPLCRLWALRILTLPRIYRGLQHDSCFDNDRVLEELGLRTRRRQRDSEWGSEPPSLNSIRRALLKAEGSKPEFSGPLGANLHHLQKALGLSAAERAVLGFYVVLNSIEWLGDATDLIGSGLSNLTVCRSLAHILNYPLKTITEVLGPNNTLHKSGLLRFDTLTGGTLQGRLELMGGLAHTLSSEHPSPERLFSMFFRPAPVPAFTLDDCAHLGPDLEILRALLANACKAHAKGVNILLYGPPGSGKTELARLLAHEAGLALFEVSAVDSTGDARLATERFPVYQLCQMALARRSKCVVLFDELEDVFPQDFDIGFIGALTVGNKHKAWTNQVMESNPVPAIWISNSIGQIDEAFLRRFSYILELNAPSRNARRRILAKQFCGLDVNEAWLDRLAGFSGLMPAHSAMALRTARLAEGSAKCDVEAIVERTLGRFYEACGRRLPACASRQPDISYKTEYLNADADLDALVAGLKHSGNARLCLYGPPGTGKTAFGQHLAGQLDRPLILRRASDLLGMYVGQSEKNIAGMFREAEHQGALLMLDEADSFLRERAGAHHSWEVTQVNEFLVGMENYGGLFVASTNTLDGLDQAVFRRFDVKVRFEVLTTAQRQALFNEILTAYGLKPAAVPESLVEELASLHGLTPGDYLAATRSLRLASEVSPQLLLQALRLELVYKPEYGRRRIGFLG